MAQKDSRKSQKQHKKSFNGFSKKALIKQKKKKSVFINKAFFENKTKRKVKSTVYTGVFSSASRGYGFVSCEKFDDDIFIPASKTLGAMGGDTVSFIIKQGSGVGHTDGEIIEIITRKSQFVLGHIEASDTPVRRGGKTVSVRSFICVPDNQKQIPFTIKISRAKAKGAQVNDRVSVKILEYPFGDTEARGEVIEVFGSGDDVNSAALAILHTGNVSTEFSADVLSEAEKLTEKAGDLSSRLDLRSKTIFTIDSEYAKDLDDAISLDEDNEGFTLGVHIADVSHYVKEGSLIDDEAMHRGTSIYFPDNVIPMLPKALSNNLCSLNRDSAKLTLSTFIRLDKGGQILSCELFESIISSAVRGVYSELNSILDKSCSEEVKSKYPKEVLNTFKSAVKLYKILQKKALKRGTFELESDEAIIIFDTNGVPCDIKKAERGISERIIEQFMICANEAIAMLAVQNGIPGIFRIHESPDPEKTKSLLEYAEDIGIDVRKFKKQADGLTSRDMQKILTKAKELNMSRPVSEMLLRSMMKAKYMPTPGIHYGLSLEYYSHFTSPIRRYADLALHRSLKKAIKESGKALKFDGIIPTNTQYKADSVMAKASEAANEGELRALSLCRTIDDIYKAFCMKDRIGEEFEAMIISVKSFGFFVALDSTCEGLVPISSLGGIGTFDETRMRLTDVYGNHYTLGALTMVRLTDVNIYNGKLSFELVYKYNDTIDKNGGS